MKRVSFAACLAALLICSAAVTGQTPADPNEVAQYATLEQVLGEHLSGAKLVAIQNDTELKVIDLAKMRVESLTDLEEFSASETYGYDTSYYAISRPYFSPNGRKVLLAVDGHAMKIDVRSGTATPVLGDRLIYEPQWWVDGKTGEACILFMDDDQERTWPMDAGQFGTYLYRPRTGVVSQVTDFPCDGGMTRDGRMIGDAVGHAMLRDLQTGKSHVIGRGDIACNASIAPDNSYRMMHLFWPHRHFGIRNAHDRVLWQIHHPADVTEWDNPRWSNMADFCTAVVDKPEGRFIAVIRISTRQVAVLDQLGSDWSVPQLWLAAGRKSRVVSWSPIAHLKLRERAKLYERVAHAQTYTPIIEELRGKTDREARAVVAALEAYVTSSIAEAKSTLDAEQADAILVELTDRFAGDPLAHRVTDELADARLTDRAEARAALDKLLKLYDELELTDGRVEQINDDIEVRQRNREPLERIEQAIESIEDRWPGSAVANRADAIARALSISNFDDADFDYADHGPVHVDATVLAVSSMPDAQQVRAYRNWVVMVKYRVDKLNEGDYVENQIIVAHQVVVDGRPTAAAAIKVGDQRKLTCDPLIRHHQINAMARADEVDDGTLPLYVEIEE